MERIEKIKELMRDNPEDSFLKHALALEYIKSGEEDKAQGLFEEVLRTDPGYVGSYYHLAKLLERKGNKTDAITWYEKGMEAAKVANDKHALNELRAAYEDITE
jgi:Tfp pilus assembly protein PilF